jgi:N-acyl-D-aspartate/D-glutamate deacylase
MLTEIEDAKFSTARQRLLDHQTDSREMQANRRRQVRREHLKQAAWDNLHAAIGRCLTYHSAEDVEEMFKLFLQLSLGSIEEDRKNAIIDG